ncbi:hypothetical protein CPC08DRAFT_711854 [Agrocybe pediades]|nr:hypothetical protein CPC08DRAFT_711854 [Agrocybe pediades]
MRSFDSLFVFALCFFEVALALPAPMRGNSKAVANKSSGSKKATVHHPVPKKKSTSTKSKSQSTSSKTKVITGSGSVKKGANAPSCPLKRPAPPGAAGKDLKAAPGKANNKANLKKAPGGKNKKKKVKRSDDEFGFTTTLGRRTGSGSEFLGFHGTTSFSLQSTAAQYTSAGRTGKHLPILSSGFNGADAELGPGLYVTDHVETAMFFANSGAASRKLKDASIKPMVCMVEAMTSSAWRTQTPKLWIPHDMVAKSKGGKNDPAILKQQADLATCAGLKPEETVRFSVLDIDNAAAGKPQKTGNQFAIPTTQFNKIYIRACLDITGKSEEDILKYFRQQGWPDRDFNTQKIRTDWAIYA